MIVTDDNTVIGDDGPDTLDRTNCFPAVELLVVAA
jgi:hypothetical protein